MVDVAPLPALPGAGDRPPMVASLSPSSMATWHQCPKRFFFEKIMRLPTETGEAAVCGSFVHVVLERLMGRPPAARTPDTAREIASEAWPGFVADPETRFGELALDAEGSRAFKRRAWAGITGYFRIEDPARVDVFATEQELRADLGGAPVHGIIDRVDRAPDGLVVTDYKSGKAPAWEDEREDKLRQVRTYAALLEAAGHHVSELRLLFLSPQLAAAAKLERTEALADDAVTALCEGPRTPTRQAVMTALHQVDDAHRQARQAVLDASPGRSAEARAAGDAAARGVATAIAATLGTDEGSLMAAWAVRRRAFFARRDAQTARPTTVALRVEQRDLDLATAEAAAIWAEASACYEAWDFPAQIGSLCRWCPFADRCDEFQASEGLA